jgi:hypothetical protein
MASTPEITESLLIKACISESDQLEAAFREFEKFGSLDDLNEGTLRLIPYLYRRLEKEGITSQQIGILKGIYTRYWYLHQMFRAKSLNICRDVLKEIPFLVLKGQAFHSLLYGNDPPTRPGEDTDVLVRIEDRGEALRRFIASGFQKKVPRLTRELLTMHPSVSLVRSGVEIDLHWDISPPTAGVDTSKVFFRDAVELASTSSLFLTASANHHLAHTLVHGWGRNEVSPIRWVLDAARLVNHPDVDWASFAENVNELGWGDVVQMQAHRLRNEHGLAIPPEVIKKIQLLGTGKHEHALTRHRTLNNGLGKKMSSLIFMRPAFLRSIREAEGRGTGYSLVTVVATSVGGEFYRGFNFLGSQAKRLSVKWGSMLRKFVSASSENKKVAEGIPSRGSSKQ